MSEWEKQFAAMQEQFVTRARQRLLSVLELLAGLERNPQDEALLLEARRHFHWLSGAGGTYKLVELTEIGTAAEEICDRLIEASGAATAEDVQALRQLLGRAQTVLH